MEYKKRVSCHHCSVDQWILRELEIFTCKLCGKKSAILNQDDYKIILGLCILHGGESLIPKLRIIVGEDYEEGSTGKATQ